MPIIPISEIEKKILSIRSEKVILDSDLANLYGVKTKALVQAVKRNGARFPKDFVFQISSEEYKALRSQFVTSSLGRGGRRYIPYAFTEHGALMAANVLRSQKAVNVSVQIIRTFILMRQALSANSDLSKRIEDLENKYDIKFKMIFDAIRALMNPSQHKRRRIGFRVK